MHNQHPDQEIEHLQLPRRLLHAWAQRCPRAGSHPLMRADSVLPFPTLCSEIFLVV